MAERHRLDLGVEDVVWPRLTALVRTCEASCIASDAFSTARDRLGRIGDAGRSPSAWAALVAVACVCSIESIAFVSAPPKLLPLRSATPAAAPVPGRAPAPSPPIGEIAHSPAPSGR